MKITKILSLSLVLLLVTVNFAQAKNKDVPQPVKIWAKSSTPEGLPTFLADMSTAGFTQEITDTDGKSVTVISADGYKYYLAETAVKLGIIPDESATKALYGNFAFRYNGMVEAGGCSKTFVTPAEFMHWGQTNGGWELPVWNSETTLAATAGMALDTKCFRQENNLVQASLKDHIALLEKKLDEEVEKAGKYQKQYGALQSELRYIKQGNLSKGMVNAFDKYLVEKFGDDFTAIYAHMDKATAEMATLSKRLDLVENAQKVLQADMSATKADVATLQNRFNGVTSQIKDLFAGAKSTNERVDYLLYALVGLAVLVLFLVWKVFSLSSKVNEIKAVVEPEVEPFVPSEKAPLTGQGQSAIKRQQNSSIADEQTEVVQSNPSVSEEEKPDKKAQAA